LTFQVARRIGPSLAREPGGILAGVAESAVRFGGQSATAPLRDVLVKRPGPAFGAAYDDTALGFLHPVDLEVAQHEHDAFSDLLTVLGVRVHQLGGEPDLVDLTYTYDPLVITDRGAIPLRPGKPTRRPEPAVVEAWTSAAGIPTIGRIEAPGTIEGGDAFWLRPDLFCVGRTLRSNDAGARQLAALVGGDVRVFDLPYWRGSAELVHLMSVISPVTDDLAVVYPPLLPAGLWELLGELSVRLIQVPDAEYPTLGCNVLAVRPGTVVMVAGNPATQRALVASGCYVYTYPATEIGINGSGGPTCMTRAVWREL
jgi:dimethylargininase